VDPILLKYFPTKTKEVKKNFFYIKRHYLLIIILCIGIVVRSYGLGNIPPGLNQDEISGAYDAFALLHYGIDRNGYQFPAMFVAWGSGMHVLTYYLSIPFIYFFGLNAFSIRMVPLLFSILSLFLFFLLVRKISNSKTALISVFLLAISPWHIMSARWNHESSLFPIFFLVPFYFLTTASQKKHYLIASIFFALTLYTYGPAFFVVPVFFTLSCIYLYIHRKLTFIDLLDISLVFLVVAYPAVLYVIINQFHIPSISSSILSIPYIPSIPHYQAASTLFSSDFISRSIENLLGFWQLLRSQYDGLIWNSIPEYGFVYKFSLPFILLGLIVFIRNIFSTKKFEPKFFILFWLFTSIALATVMPVNINRISILFLPIIYLMAEGIYFLCRNRLALIVIIGLYLSSFAGFSYAYFKSYPDAIGGAFFETFGDAINYASENTKGHICVTDSVNMPYIFVLFHRKTDPNVFLDTVRYENPEAELRRVASFDRYYFGRHNCRDKDIAAHIVPLYEIDDFEVNNLFTTKKYRDESCFTVRYFSH